MSSGLGCVPPLSVSASFLDWPVRELVAFVATAGGRRLPRARTADGAYFIVKDRKGQALAYVYCETNRGSSQRRGFLLAMRRIKASIARLPE